MRGPASMSALTQFLMNGRVKWAGNIRCNSFLRGVPFVFVLLIGCKARQKESVQPAIEFTQVPPTSAGGPNTRGTIAGRAIGGRSSQQIVLYAKAKGGSWWIQPLASKPFTAIRSDQTWESPTHLGTEYAALLVDADYKPQNMTYDLPMPGGQIRAVATVRGRPDSAPRDTVVKLQFSGYEWLVRAIPSSRNDLNHDYDSTNAHVDSKGALHLQITNRQGKWICSEVTLTKNLGYGTYLFTVEDVSHLEPATIFSAFTWDELPTDPNHREMDIEISRWGDSAGENGRYVIQPYYVPSNISRFNAPAAQLTFSLRWELGKALFQTFRGDVTKSKSHALAEHLFTAGVPSPGLESIRMNFCPVDNHEAPQQHPSEIVVGNFQYLP